MSDQIKQIQASYHPVEDRILFKLHTKEKQTINAWITRRYLKLLLPLLQGQHPETGKTFLKEEQMKKAFVHDDMAVIDIEQMSESSSSSATAEPPEFPLGENPILLAKITFKEIEENPMLIMEPETGSGIMLGYHPQMIKAMMAILKQAVEKAQWSMGDSFLHQLPSNTTLQ